MELGLVKPMFPCSKKKVKDPVSRLLASYFRTGGNDSIDNISDHVRIAPLNDWKNCNKYFYILKYFFVLKNYLINNFFYLKWEFFYLRIIKN